MKYINFAIFSFKDNVIHANASITPEEIIKLHEVESQEISKMSKTLHEFLHEVLNEVFEKALYPVYY